MDDNLKTKASIGIIISLLALAMLIIMIGGTFFDIDQKSESPRKQKQITSPSIAREFIIPAGGITIDKDISGQKLRFLAGDKIVIEILNEPFEKRKLVFLNQTKNSVKIRKEITTLWGRNPGFVEFMNTGKEEFFVQVKINP